MKLWTILLAPVLSLLVGTMPPGLTCVLTHLREVRSLYFSVHMAYRHGNYWNGYAFRNIFDTKKCT